MPLPVDYTDAFTPTGALSELPATTPRGLNAITTQINQNTADIAGMSSSGALFTTVTTSEALSAGNLVNLWNSSGLKARRANATTTGLTADGYVLANVGSGATATVYLNGVNTAATGLTVGAPVYLAASAGGATATAPSTAGNLSQRVGKALSATSYIFHPLTPITVA
jgi:hypothetical protein